MSVCQPETAPYRWLAFARTQSSLARVCSTNPLNGCNPFVVFCLILLYTVAAPLVSLPIDDLGQRARLGNRDRGFCQDLASCRRTSPPLAKDALTGDQVCALYSWRLRRTQVNNVDPSSLVSLAI